MAEVDLAINQDIKAIVPSNDMLPEFLLWSLKHLGPEIERKGVGATVKGVTLHDVKELKASLPPLHEQHRIVGILNRASHIERLRARATDRLQQFIPALFLKMFGDPAVNPMGWSRVPLGQICAIVGGGTPRRDNTTYFGGPVPWATPTDVTALSGPSIGSTRETLTETGVRESSARLVPAGTVLLTSRATIGYTAIAAAPMTTNQGFANLICGERLLSEYLAIWLRLRRDYLIQLAGGTTFKEISKSTLKKIEIPVPPLEKQHEFATLISCAYRTMDKAQTAADTAAALSASLMDRLLA